MKNVQNVAKFCSLRFYYDYLRKSIAIVIDSDANAGA